MQFGGCALALLHEPIDTRAGGAECCQPMGDEMANQAETRLAEDAYNRILAHIMSGKLAAGTVIQEKVLVEELGLSRTPMRDALLILEGEGLLVRESRRVVRVLSMDLSHYVENLAIRRLLECEAAALAVGRIPEDSLDRMKAEIETLMSNHEARMPAGREAVRRIDEELHRTIAEAAGNRQLAEIVAGLRRKTHIFDLKNMPERFLETCREHLAIIEALRPDSEPDAARQAMYRHINAIRESIVRRLLQN